MKKRIFIIFFTILLGLAVTSYTSADTITLSGRINAPYIYESTAKKPGFLIEIVKEAFKSSGHTIKFKSLPWKRAIVMAKNGYINAVVGIEKKNLPTFIYPTEEQGISQLCFYIKKSNNWKYTGLVSLRKVILGTVDGVSYGELNSYVQKYRNTKYIDQINGTNNLYRNVIKLKANRISAFIEDKMIVDSMKSKINNMVPIKKAGELEKIHLYVAFTPKHKNSKKYAKILSDAMISMRKNGKLKSILDKYGIEDWKK